MPILLPFHFLNDGLASSIKDVKKWRKNLNYQIAMAEFFFSLFFLCSSQNIDSIPVVDYSLHGLSQRTVLVGVSEKREKRFQAGPGCHQKQNL